MATFIAFCINLDNAFIAISVGRLLQATLLFHHKSVNVVDYYAHVQPVVVDKRLSFLHVLLRVKVFEGFVVGGGVA